MRFRDPSTIAQAFVGRVTVDADGAAVRAIIGGVAPRVVDIAVVQGGIKVCPVRPFLASSPGVVTNNGAQDLHSFSWWIYDDPAHGQRDLGRLAEALSRAYDAPRGAAPLSVGAVLSGVLTAPRLDTSLGLLSRRYDFTIIA